MPLSIFIRCFQRVKSNSNDRGLELTQSVKELSSALSGTFSHARAREKALSDYGLRPFAAREWEKVAEGRMRALA